MRVIRPGESSVKDWALDEAGRTVEYGSRVSVLYPTSVGTAAPIVRHHGATVRGFVSGLVDPMTHQADDRELSVLVEFVDGGRLFVAPYRLQVERPDEEELDRRAEAVWRSMGCPPGMSVDEAKAIAQGIVK